MIEVAVHSDSTQDGVRFAGGAVHVEAAGDEAVDHMLDLGVARAFLHHDDHESFLFPSLPDVVAGLVPRFSLKIRPCECLSYPDCPTSSFIPAFAGAVAGMHGVALGGPGFVNDG